MKTPRFNFPNFSWFLKVKKMRELGWTFSKRAKSFCSKFLPRFFSVNISNSDVDAMDSVQTFYADQGVKERLSAKPRSVEPRCFQNGWFLSWLLMFQDHQRNSLVNVRQSHSIQNSKAFRKFGNISAFRPRSKEKS